MPLVDNDIKRGQIQEELPQTPVAPIASEFDDLDPTLSETAGAAFRSENIVGSAISSEVFSVTPKKFYEVEDDFNPFDELAGFEQHEDRFLNTFNRTAFEAVKADIKREEKDNRILNASGFGGLVLEVGASIFDPTILIPGGTFVKGARLGFNVAKSAKSVGVAAGAGAAVQETALHATQQTRTKTETALAVGGSVILGAALGAAGAKLLTNKEFTEVATKLEQELLGEVPDAQGIAREIVTRAQSVGASSVDEIDISDLNLSGKAAEAASKITANLRLNPGVQTALSPSKQVRLIYHQLVDNPIATNLEARGETLGPSVENTLKEIERGYVGKFIRNRDDLYKKARKGGLKISKSEFNQRVGRASRNNDIDREGNDFVTRAAQAARNDVLDPVLKRGQKAGLISKDITTATAASYLHRVWNVRALNLKEDRFRKLTTNYISQEVDRIVNRSQLLDTGDRLASLEEVNLKTKRTNEKLSGIESRLVQGAKQRERLTTRLSNRVLDRRAAYGKTLPDYIRKAIGSDGDFLEQVTQAKQTRKKQSKDRFPILSIIKSKGGIRVGSEIDKELRAIGVTPRTRPGLFKKNSGLGDIDNFPLVEDDILLLNAVDDGAGYADRSSLLDGIAAEISGNPWRLPDDELFDEAADYVEDLLAELGLEGNPTTSQVRKALKVAAQADEKSDVLDDVVKNIEGDLAKLDARLDSLRDERVLAKSKIDDLSSEVAKLNDDLADVTEVELRSPYVKNVVELARNKRETATTKIKRSQLETRISEIESASGKGRISDELFAELSAAKVDVGNLTVRLSNLEEKAVKIEKFIPENRLGADDFISEADRASYIDEIVDSIFNNLTGRSAGDIPQSIIPVERGPLKGRTFRIADELVEEFLESDIEFVLRRYARTAGAEIELADRFGSADLKNQFIDIANDYKELRSKTRDPKEIAKLERAEKRDVKNLSAFRDLIRGTYNPSGNSGTWAQITRAALAYNFVVSLGGVTISSLPDAARLLSARGFYTEFVPALATNLKGIRVSASQARDFGTGVERLMQSRFAGLAELQDPYASGAPFERMIQNATTLFAKYTGLALWNDIMKGGVAVLDQNRLLKNTLAGGYKNLNKAELQFMGKSAISEEVAERIAKQFKKYGEKDGTIYVANPEAWDDQNARRVYAAAINKSSDATIITKGVADVPLALHQNTGRILGQFTSFLFAANQKLLIAGLQENQLRFAQLVLTATALGSMVSYLKKLERGDFEGAERLLANPGQLIGEGLDRSGILSVMFDVSNRLDKISTAFDGPGISITDGISKLSGDKDPTGGPGRFASRNLGSLLGPSMGAFEDFGRIASIPIRDAKKGDASAVIRRIPGGSLPIAKTILHTQVKPRLQEAFENE